MINWTIKDNQFCFTLDTNSKQNKTVWEHEENSPYYDPLRTLEINGLAEFKEGAFWVEPHEIYKLDSIDLQILDIPETYPYAILIESEGIINRPGFLFKPGFYDFVPNGTKLQMIRKANIITARDKSISYLLSESQLNLCEQIELFNSDSESNFDRYRMFQDTATIQKLAKESNAYLDSYLANENIILPKDIQLDLKYENSTLKVIPTLPSEEQAISDSFINSFTKKLSASSNYSLYDEQGQRKRLVFSEDQTNQLKKLKRDFSYVKDQAKIQKIIEHPESFFDTDILDVSCFYSDRVIDYGIYKPKCYPFISPYKSQWIPGVQVENRAKGTTRLTFKNEEELNIFEHYIQTAEKGKKQTVQFEDAILAIEDAKAIVKLSREQLRNLNKPITLQKEVNNKVLLIQENAEELEYIYQIQEKEIERAIPLHSIGNLKSGIILKPHQEEGVAWLQYLYKNNYKGCLLADDMGLGKTLQVLYFINWYFSITPAKDRKPCLIVAPISLLENWEQEYDKFFDSQFYQVNVSTFSIKDISKTFNLSDVKKIENSDIVLTNYETIRSCQLNFCAVDFSIIATDEAQKIKTPGTMVTNAMKALKGDFRIALTGTPVENTFLDLWCIVDFAIPGLLGNAKQFAKKYQTPLQDKETNVIELGNSIRLELGDYIKRRLKSSLSLDLPKKHIKKLRIPMPEVQYKRYIQEVNHVVQKKNNNKKNSPGDILQGIMRLKMISDHPFLLEFDISQFTPEELVESSAKLIQTIHILKQIKQKNEKAIIYTQFKEVQKLLRRVVKSYFNFTPFIINGDTPASQAQAKKSILTRQASIDYFESIDGFNIIIMSPIAAGMGLNVVGANHVIHYSRHWNPAKEEQATDRVYRIGQTKEVYIYYPMAITQNFDSFDVLLDKLLSNKKELATASLFPSEQTEISKDELYHSLYNKSIAGTSEYITAQDISKVDTLTLSNIIKQIFIQKGKLVNTSNQEFFTNINFTIDSDEVPSIVKCSSIANHKHLNILLQAQEIAKRKFNKFYQPIYCYLSCPNSLKEFTKEQAKSIRLINKEDLLTWIEREPVKWSDVINN